MSAAGRRDGIAGGAIAVTLAYLALAFGWRTWLQWRRTGDTGFRLSANAPARDRVASLLMIAGGVIGFLGAAVAGHRPPARGYPVPDGLRRGGLVALLLALAATLRAQLDMGRSWRVGVDAGERTDLVTTGWFARSRNPIFACMAGFAVATTVAVPTRLTTVGAGLMLAGVQTQVRLVEEPYLLATHGDDYRRYAASVGRFVPGLGRLP
jgi:protein-S-isoprenylcysteine O-methyltransferase Ste14